MLKICDIFLNMFIEQQFITVVLSNETHILRLIKQLN